jgi:hypothetical protein
MQSVKRLQKYSRCPPENGVVWVWHVNHVKCDVFGAWVFGVLKDIGSVMAPTGSILFPPKP